MLTSCYASSAYLLVNAVTVVHCVTIPCVLLHETQRKSATGASQVLQSSKTISGRARVCTSVLSVSRTVIDFGECQVLLI
jgi:hypothetical protein